MRHSLRAIAMTVVLAAGPLAAGPAQLPTTRTVRYDSLGFDVQMPITALKRAIPAVAPVLVEDVYTHGELVYTVKVVQAPPDALTTSAIELSMQRYQAAAGGKDSSQRWEKGLETDAALLVKRLKGPLPPQELGAAAGVCIRKALKGAQSYTSLGMLPLGGDTAPILTLAVTGPIGRTEDVVKLADSFVQGVSLSAPKPEEPVATPKPPATASPKPRPAPAAKPAPLKAGDIELVGSVESIDAGQHILNVMVSQIRMRAMSPIRFGQPRRKVVYYKTLPEGIAVGSQVRLVGANSGVGNPMTADTIQLAP